MKRINILLLLISTILGSCEKDEGFSGDDGTFSDSRDGREYKWTKIGDQIWMAENLNATCYADSTEIPLVEEGWVPSVTDKAYCYYHNSEANGDVYGALYTWAAAMNGSPSSDANPSGIQGVCPTGWHLPSDSEWKELEVYLGLSQEEADQPTYRDTVVGGKLKQRGTSLWNSPNTGATNESGFTALPSGIRSNHEWFELVSRYTAFWTTTEFPFYAPGIDTQVWDRSLVYDRSDLWRTGGPKGKGLAVRCVKDE